MARRSRTTTTFRNETSKLRERLQELEETLRAIRSGEVDALLVSGAGGDRVYTLQGADHPYRVMVQTINEGAATLSKGGVVLYANHRFAEMVLLPLERLIGSRLHDFVQTLGCGTLDELLKRAETAPQKEQCDFLTSGGKLLPVYLSLSALSETGFQGICMIATDLSEQKLREGELAKANKALEVEVAERVRVERALRETEEMFRAFMNHNPAVIFIKDEEGCYVFFNKKMEQAYGVRLEDLLGKTPFAWMPEATGKVVRKHDLDALSTDAPTEEIEVLQLPNGTLHERLVVRFPFRDTSGTRLVGGVALDLTAQKRAETSLRALSGRVLKWQDEERRRIARELHDSTGQTLTALAMQLAFVRAGGGDGTRVSKALEDCESLAEQAAVEIRNLSHLLHPPDLDRVGLGPAIQWYCARFGQRTGIRVELGLPAELERLPQDVEIAMFRVVQESLENVRRHSGSPTATVRVSRKETEVVVEVEDEGKGIPAALLNDTAENISRLGVGVAGMRERLRQLAGRLEIISHGRGTTVRAIVPLLAAE
jgi:PAS domain S-box-containing protein